MRTWITVVGLVSAVAVAGLAPSSASAACAKNVVVYDASWCPYCKKVKALLSRHGIAYKVINAETSAARVFMAKNFRTTSIPVTVVDGSHVVGFSEARLKQLLCI